MLMHESAEVSLTMFAKHSNSMIILYNCTINHSACNWNIHMLAAGALITLAHRA